MKKYIVESANGIKYDILADNFLLITQKNERQLVMLINEKQVAIFINPACLIEFTE